MKIYLASPFFDEEQLERVKRVERALADNPTVTEVFSPRLQQVEHLEHGSDEWAISFTITTLNTLSGVMLSLRFTIM